ncbi:hypothetical protein JCM11641_005546 [Rhodosporidiobolus odoratus]
MSFSLSSFSFGATELDQLLPGLAKFDSHPPEPPAAHSEPSRSSFRRPLVKQEPPVAQVSRSREHSHRDGQEHSGMPKKNGQKKKNAGKARSTTAATVKQVTTSVTKVAPSVQSNGHSALAVYPSAIYNDDLSAVPFQAPKPRLVTRPLPPLQPLPSHYDEASLPRSPSSTARSFIRPVYEPSHAEYDYSDDFYGHAGEQDATLSTSTDFSSDSLASSEFEYSGDEEDGGEYFDTYDDEDEERPFPSPQRAKQDRYVRAPDMDSSSSSGEVLLLPAPKGKGKATHFSSSFVDSSLLPTPPSPTGGFSYTFTPSTPAAPLLSSATASTFSTSKISHLNKIPSPSAAALEAYYNPPASTLESPTEQYPRGRNPHPRLLWRSSLDVHALAALDAHHARIVGGPLPRMTVEEKIRLSSSGVEAERDHPGAREEGERGRSRSERRWQAGRGRRAWSVEGRKWSKEVEKCGL